MMKTSDPSHESTFFQPLSFGGTLQRMMNVYGLGFRTFHLIMFFVGGTYTLLWSCLLLVLPEALFGIDASIEDPLYRETNSMAFVGLFIIQCCLAGLFACVGHAAIIHVTADIYLHQRTTSTVRSYLTVGFRYFCPNLCAGIVIIVGVGLGLLLFILPGIFLAIMWLLAHAGIVIEGVGGLGGLKRSWGLVSRNWCYVFCIKFFVMFPFSILNQLWVSFVAPTIFTFWGFIVGAIPGLLISPFLSILVTVMYMNLRIKKEGLDAQALANNIGVVDPTASTIAEAGGAAEVPSGNTSDNNNNNDPTAIVGLPDFA